MDGQGDYVFRRSRTLTGTTSQQVAPTAEKRGQLKTDRLKTHERQQKRRHTLKVALAAGCIGGILWFLGAMFIRTPVVSFVQGVNTPNAHQYQQSISAALNSNILQRFGFFVQQVPLEVYIKQKHSEVQSLTVSRTWYGGDVAFTIGFRRPILLWQTGGQRFYVDSEGVAFAYNHFAEPSVTVTDESGIPPEATGGAVASSRFIRFLGQMVGAVDQYGKGRVVSIAIPSSTREIDLRLEGRDYPVRTHIDRDPLEQAEDIANALSHLDSKGIKPAYVDVRVAHKAFYK